MTDTTVTAIDPAGSRVTLADGRELCLRPAAVDHRRRAAADPDRGRRARRRPLPAHAAGLRCAARAPGGRRTCGGRRRRLDRQRVRGLGAPARPRGHDHRSARAAERADLRPGDRRASTATCTATTASSSSLGEGVEAFEGDGAVARVRTASGRMIECDFVVVGIGVVPRVELAEPRRPRSRQRHPRRRAASDLGAGRVRGRRRRERLASVLRRAGPGRALGQRAQPGSGGGARDARRAGQLRPDPVLLLRPVRRRHGVLGLRADVGRGRVPRRPRPTASSSPSGCTTGACSPA